MKLTTKQVATLLDVGQGTVQSYIRQGLLSATTQPWGLRSVFVVDEAELRRFAVDNGFSLPDDLRIVPPVKRRRY